MGGRGRKGTGRVGGSGRPGPGVGCSRSALLSVSLSHPEQNGTKGGEPRGSLVRRLAGPCGSLVLAWFCSPCAGAWPPYDPERCPRAGGPSASRGSRAAKFSARRGAVRRVGAQVRAWHPRSQWERAWSRPALPGAWGLRASTLRKEELTPSSSPRPSWPEPAYPECPVPAPALGSQVELLVTQLWSSAREPTQPATD